MNDAEMPVFFCIDNGLKSTPLGKDTAQPINSTTRSSRFRLPSLGSRASRAVREVGFGVFIAGKFVRDHNDMRTKRAYIFAGYSATSFAPGRTREEKWGLSRKTTHPGMNALRPLSATSGAMRDILLINAVVLVAEVGDFKRFSSPHQLCLQASGVGCRSLGEPHADAALLISRDENDAGFFKGTIKMKN